MNEKIRFIITVLSFLSGSIVYNVISGDWDWTRVLLVTLVLSVGWVLIHGVKEK